MEVLARDLRSLGLYTARSLSYDGVEYEMLEHALTPEQRGIYDAYGPEPCRPFRNAPRPVCPDRPSR